MHKLRISLKKRERERKTLTTHLQRHPAKNKLRHEWVSRPFQHIYLALKHSKLSRVSRIIRWVCAVRDVLYSACYRWCVSLRVQVSNQSNTLEYHRDLRPWCALQLKRMAAFPQAKSEWYFTFFIILQADLFSFFFLELKSARVCLALLYSCFSALMLCMLKCLNCRCDLYPAVHGN